MRTIGVITCLAVACLLPLACQPSSADSVATGAPDTGDTDPGDLDTDSVATPYLDLALEAETWIASARRETDHGVEWLDIPDEPDSVGHTLYHGSPGVVLFYLELAKTTGEPRFLEEAIAGASELVHTLEADPADADIAPSLYSGIGGAAFSLHQVYLATDDERFRQAAVDALVRIRTAATEKGDGIGWIEPMPFSDIHGESGLTEVLDMTHGAAGIGLLFLYAAENDLHPDALAWATDTGDRLLELSTPVEGGLEWEMVTDNPIDFKAPGFSHGTAGIAYFLARLYEETNAQRFLDAALAGAGRLQAIATVDEEKGTRLVYHHEGEGEDLYYLGWCHGPVGTGRLFHQLKKVTGDDSFGLWVTGGVAGALAMGAPEARSPGFWNNVSQCCGDAGLGEYGLSLYEVTGDEQYLDLARRVASGLEEKGQAAAAGVCWVQAEHRARPDFLKAHTGYMQGAAGIGSFFLRLHGVERESSTKIHLPDSPFG